MNPKQEGQFTIGKIPLRNDYEGRVEATLLSKKSDRPTAKAILYIHGFVDYFFQYELADWANNLGFNFYAIDLRKYGRSILPHQKPNNFKDYTEYFEELDLAVEQIRNKDGNNQLVLMGHSTGGLISSLYAHHNKNEGTIDALILNSPFFDFNMPSLQKKLGLPIIAAVGRIWPDLPSPAGLKEGYATSIHTDFKGEWEFNVEHKPIAGFPINLGWVNAIYQAQHELQKGLDIEIPILVMYAEKSVSPGNYRLEMRTADAVLEVSDIARFSQVLGKNTEVAVIRDGIHDLVLSKKPVREKVYNCMQAFIERVKMPTK